jgi:serine/threonine protein phosphatase PrpC
MATETHVEGPADSAVAELFTELLRRTHLTAPDELPIVIGEQAGLIGARDLALYVIDYEQGMLMPLTGSSDVVLEPLSVAGTVAGRAFATTTILRVAGAPPGVDRLWVPLIDGTERVGAMGLSFAEGSVSERLVEICERFAHLVAILTITKGKYGDALETTRRVKEMTLASELLWSLVPPLVCATDSVALAAMLEPSYDNGGDALDYAINGRVLHLALFDAMGHGLAAAGVAAFAVAAYRHSRRKASNLLETYTAMDDAVGTQFPDRRFVTAVIAELDLDSGQLTWISAGHPPPLLIRGGRRALPLDVTPSPPLGIEIAHAPPAIATESLEPGDLLLLYTDGLTEARAADGQMLHTEGLAHFIEREASAGQTAPETLRRLRQAILSSPRTRLRDDATAMLLEWRRGGELKLMPQTVL